METELYMVCQNAKMFEAEILYNLGRETLKNQMCFHFDWDSFSAIDEHNEHYGIIPKSVANNTYELQKRIFHVISNYC